MTSALYFTTTCQIEGVNLLAIWTSPEESGVLQISMKDRTFNVKAGGVAKFGGYEIIR
jgi:hypothetical protein